MNLYERAASVGLNHIKSWLPDGEEENGQWSAINPLRNDKQKGSFKINLTTGAFNDYADDEMVGRDAVTLYAKLNGLSNFEAAKQILEKYDSSYFPTEYTKEEIKDEWRQVTRPIRNAPELPKQKNEVARWPLERKIGDEWKPVMWAVRTVKDGSKTDYPYTLFSNAKNYEWRCKALHGVKYPLYNARSLEEKTNARVLLVEGQKAAAIVKDILTEWAVVGWYGGAQSISLSDLSDLNGREVYFSFDADTPGRKAIEKIEKLLPNTKIHLVYPPADVPAGWDLADAVESGWSVKQIEEHILKDVPVVQNSVPEVQTLVPCMSPIRFTPVDEDLKFTIRSFIFVSKPTNINKRTGQIEESYVLADDWIGQWVEHDTQLANSIMQDYTTGLKQTAYDNKSEWLAAVEHRADELQIPQSNITDSVAKKIERAIELRGRKFNQVADYIDDIRRLYPEHNPLILDQFLKIFTFDIERYENESLEEYEMREEKAFRCYRELWHKFFVKMHGRIKGTKRKEDGSYYGLIATDIVPILVGGQGIGKTTLVKYLALDDTLYADLGSGLKSKFGSAETVKKVRGKLLVEIGEMKVMKSADDVEQVKSFVSKEIADVDIKYVEQQYSTPMTCSYIGTSNPLQYLTDTTGNRRWNPVKLKNIDKQMVTSEEGKKLIRRLHSYYAEFVENMTKDQILDESRIEEGSELDLFMKELQEEALITYSDYEACVTVINHWLNGNGSIVAAEPGAELMQADVERLCFNEGYHMRISQKSIIRAMEDCGLVQISKSTKKGVKRVWIKPIAEVSENDDVPF